MPSCSQARHGRAPRGPVLRALGLPEDPTELLDGRARTLEKAYREVASRIDQGTEVTVDEEGKLHLSALEAIPDPPTVTVLRKLVQAMLPRVGLPEVILEVMHFVSAAVTRGAASSRAVLRSSDGHVRA